MVERWIADSELSTKWPIYTRANVGEVFPDPVTPLTRDTGIWLAELGWRDAWAAGRRLRSRRVRSGQHRAARHHGWLLLLERIADPALRRTRAGSVCSGDGRTVLRGAAGHPAVRGAARRRRPGQDGEDRPDVRVGPHDRGSSRAHRRPDHDEAAARRAARPELDERSRARRPLLHTHGRALPRPVRAPHLHVVHGDAAGWDPHGDGRGSRRPIADDALDRRAGRGRFGGAVSCDVGHGPRGRCIAVVDGRVRQRHRGAARSTCARRPTRAR